MSEEPSPELTPQQWQDMALEYHSRAGFYKSCIESWLLYMMDTKDSRTQMKMSLHGSMSETLKRFKKEGS